MVLLQSFVSALVTTALIVVIARFALGFLLSESQNYIPSLCVGLGFLLGHYSVSGGVTDPETGIAVAKFCGSAVGIIVLGAGFRYRATRMNAA